MKKLSVKRFRKIIYGHYDHCRRELPWRETCDPYHILVSEFMLQQTQVERVMRKYLEFLRAFPDFQTCARATLRDVLSVWQGLGYNRRAKALKETAKIVVDRYNGELPGSIEILMTFPGIGSATASAISAFAFNHAHPFLETNIRRVFIHFFFPSGKKVSDAKLLPLVARTLDTSNPRDWYYALMDYGVMLRKRYPDLLRRCSHYQRQPPFKGSDREIRGMILKSLVGEKAVSEAGLVRRYGIDSKRIRKIIVELEKEGFIRRSGRKVDLA